MAHASYISPRLEKKLIMKTWLKTWLPCSCQLQLCNITVSCIDLVWRGLMAYITLIKELDNYFCNTCDRKTICM